uniref:hypothetical protein n=1 Tax=Neisseria sicca TaxID=490 RepID=UPI001C9A2858
DGELWGDGMNGRVVGGSDMGLGEEKGGDGGFVGLRKGGMGGYLIDKLFVVCDKSGERWCEKREGD